MICSRIAAWFLTGCAALALFAGGEAHGGLITNGDFETGSLAGWTVANQLSSTDYAGGTDTLGASTSRGPAGRPPSQGR